MFWNSALFRAVAAIDLAGIGAFTLVVAVVLAQDRER